MKPKRKTEAQVIAELRKTTRVQGGITAAAKLYGVSPGFISDVEKGKSPLTERLALAMGYKRIVEFEQV